MENLKALYVAIIWIAFAAIILPLVVAFAAAARESYRAAKNS